MKKKFWKVAGMLTGILSVIFGIMVWAANAGSRVSHEYYGGDAYTGIQQAAADTGNNVLAMAGMLRLGIGALLFIGGLALICAFGMSLSEEAQEPARVSPEAPKAGMPEPEPEEPVPVTE